MALPAMLLTRSSTGPAAPPWAPHPLQGWWMAGLQSSGLKRHRTRATTSAARAAVALLPAMCAAAKATSYEACALLVAAEAAEAEVRSARELASSVMKERGERARDREEIARVARQLATMDAQVSAF